MLIFKKSHYMCHNQQLNLTIDLHSTLSLLQQDRTNVLFKQVQDQRTLRGRSNDAIAAACVYIACRQEGVPRTFRGEQKIKFCEKLQQFQSESKLFL